MWMLVASLLILRRGHAERNISYAALTIAIAMTLNTDQVYRPLDKLAGGANFATLPADLALMVGVFFLGRGVLKASDQQSGAIQFALGRVVLAAAVISAVSTFLFIDGGATTTNFMLDLGDQLSAGAYSMIQFTYYAIVLSAMAVLAARQVRKSTGVQRMPPTSLLVGSILGVLLSVVVITMDIAHVAGDLGLMATVAIAYEPLHLMTFVLLCLGFAGQPAARALQARSRNRTTRMLVYRP
jgi:glucan phosphoethanolaminetransferase (alkaline phosphatase superfamily)